jgi:hypothetical protein
MKTIILLALAVLTLLFAPRTHGDSIFLLSNFEQNLVNAPVFDAAGVPLEGPNFLAELWGGITPESLVPAISHAVGDRLIIPFDIQGYFEDGREAQVPSLVNGGYAWLQVRAWDARLGPTYEEVAALDMGGYGESSPFYAQGKHPGDMLGTPAPLIGLESFSLRAVPEPATWTFLALGGAGVVWAARRKREPRLGIRLQPTAESIGQPKRG